ncbi:ABC transporter ATP-binding protein [Miniphocaeibacter halophilus]|uniref:ABC transporter ATP-binding protein n=1 Tax=Miniphocaeibacter halophilus TaxID=2931922 RepID=A0AC61MRZ7_9FIRM|nr:ABC transporter ATP-binding protein [Miniphocaeibacter halophilus]QQK08450.1 ABC transporter ATP-binding protein [Miniphocaeibacter halophilus]
MENIIKINGLTKKFGNFEAVSNVNIEVKEKDIYGLIGKNGAGKTTLLRMIMGLSSPTSGNISLFGGKNEKENAINRKKIGFYIGQSFFPYLNAKENIEYHRRMKGVKGRKETRRVLEIVGLKNVNKPFKSFSMGMKQRLGLAAAMLGNPELIVLDEPINGLDPQGIVDIRNIINILNEEYNTTIIVSSHILSELDLVASKFGIIDHGKLLEEISFEELHKKTTSAIIIKVDNVEKTRNILNDKFNIENINITNHSTLIVNDNIDHLNIINKTMVENNIDVFEIYKRESSLEDYYFDLIGGKNND